MKEGSLEGVEEGVDEEGQVKIRPWYIQRKERGRSENCQVVLLYIEPIAGFVLCIFRKTKVEKNQAFGKDSGI